MNFPILPTFAISPSNTNNAPTLTLSATNTRINNDSAVKIFNNVNAGGGVSGNGVADTGSSSIIKQIVFTVKAVKDFASEIVTIDGVSIPLVNTPADVSFTNGGSYFVTVIGSAVQVTLKNLSLSTANDNNQVNSLIESITYQNISTTPTDGTRQILVSKITDGGVTSSPSNPYAGSNYKDFGNTLLSSVTVDTLAPNAPSTLSVPENDNGGISVAEAIDGTMVIVSLVDTMAAVNDVISVVIDGASTLYTITQNDIDAESASVSIPKSVLDLAGYGSAQVTATIKDATNNVSQPSQPVTINVIAPNALPTGEVTILGTPTQGQMLTATNNLADANGMGTVSYTWYADGVEISGATGNTFTLTQAQVDKKMTVTARYFDGQNTAESVTSSQTAEIANINDAPVGVSDSDNAIEASGVANATVGINPSGNVLNNDTDVDNATNTLTIKSILKGMTGTATAVTVSTTSTNGTSIAGTYGTLVMGADGSYIYSVNQSNVTVQALNIGSAPLSDVFTYTVKDPLGLTSTATITVMVNGANDAAVIAGTSTATLTETNIAQSTSGTLTITDVDSATTFVAQTNVAGSNGYGKFSVTTAGAWTYTMNTAHDEFIAGQAYTDSLTVTSADGTSKLVTVTINGADDAAYISGTSTASLTETDGIQTANGTVAVMDVDSAVNNTFVAQTNVAKTYGNFTISTAGVWSYVMSSAHNEFVAGTNYTDSITVASVTGASKVITVTMVGTNDAAVIGGVNTASLTESNIVQSTGGTLTISDVDSTASFASYVTGSNGYGTFTLSTTGVWTYSMNTAHDEFLLGQVYTDSMTVKAVDGTTKLVTVSMTGTNDAPTLSYIDTGSSNTDAITNSAAMSVSSLEASATWQYQVDGGTWQTGTGTTFTMSEGTHDYNVRQKDTLNNVSATTSKTVTLDTVAPNAAGVTLASDTGASNTDGVTNNGTVNVSLSSDTNNWQYSINGGTTWSNGTGTTFSLGAGTYAANSVQVQAFDKAGNVALTKYAPALTVDKSAPTVSVAIGNTALPFGQSTTVNFNFSEAVYGFANSDVSVSGGSLSNITGSGQSYSATFTAGYSYNAGSYVSVNANTYTDQAGNNGGSNSTGAFRVGPNVADIARNMSLYVGYYGHNGSDPYGYIDIRLSGNNDLQGATVTLYDGWGHSWSRTVQGAGGTTDFGQITGTGDNVTRYHADITYAGISASIGGGVAYEVTSRGLFNWGIFKCISSDTAYSFCYTSPIVLDLNGDGVQTVDTAHGVHFDMAGDGMKESIGWVDSHDALLVRDINHDGQINDGTELFGSESVLKNGEKAGDGWSALADVDSNGDGKIDAADAVFAEINVWVDANSDGLAETGELRSLSDAGIQHIDLAHATSNTTQNNNVLFGTGQFTFTDGTTAAMTDAWFDVGQTLSLDFTQVNGQPIDMTDGQAQTLQINVQDLVAYTQINGALQISCDAIDAVNIVNDGVAVVAQSQIINDQILNAYDVNQDGVSDLLILLAINQTSLFTVH